MDLRKPFSFIDISGIFVNCCSAMKQLQPTNIWKSLNPNMKAAYKNVKNTVTKAIGINKKVRYRCGSLFVCEASTFKELFTKLNSSKMAIN